MKDRTCILVTHHIRLCLPAAAMVIRMSGGTAEIEELDEKDLEDLPEMGTGDELTITATPSSKGQTPDTATPVNGALITKEHREKVCAGADRV